MKLAKILHVVEQKQPLINCIGASINEDVIKRMKTEPFSFRLDTRNYTDLDKMFSVTLRLFDTNFNGVITKFLDMNMLVGRHASTEQLEFNSIDTLLIGTMSYVWVTPIPT